MAFTTLDDYLSALNTCGVQDLADPVKTDFINLARRQIIESYPWPFREQGDDNVHGITVADPWTTPLAIPEYSKVKYVYNSDGDLMTPLSELQLAEKGVVFSPDLSPIDTGTPEFFAVFYIPNGLSRDIYVIPYPYGPITVVPLQSADPLDATTNQTDEQIPVGFKWAVVYCAAAHAFSMIGINDLAVTFQTRYNEALEAMRNEQFQPTFQTPEVSYPQGP